MKFVKTIPVEDLPPNTQRVIAFGGKYVALFHYDGRLSAIGYEGLSHADAPIAGFMKEIEGERYITYPWSGHKFNIMSGHSSEASEICQPVYKVKIEEGYIFVSEQPFKDGYFPPKNEIGV